MHGRNFLMHTEKYKKKTKTGNLLLRKFTIKSDLTGRSQDREMEQKYFFRKLCISLSLSLLFLCTFPPFFFLLSLSVSLSLRERKHCPSMFDAKWLDSAWVWPCLCYAFVVEIMVSVFSFVSRIDEILEFLGYFLKLEEIR